MAEPSDFSSELQRVFFHAKLLSTKREIEEYLDAECGVDSPDKQLILRMLDAGKQQLTSPLTDALGNARSTMELIEAAASEQSYVDGNLQDLPTIPRYNVVEFLGEGAMGRVYYAEQLEPIRRQVAVKVIKPGMDSAQVLARFEREKQTLAMLDHSNICEVYDAGTTERGYPYFSMELVSGDSIDRYCQANSLSIEDRIRLMLEVCRATHHAHKRGIIHRDLKPSNVLVKNVDDQPVVKVIDFGVAKALSSDLEDSGYQTYFKQLIGTPMYMSPEQVELGPKKIDERSDVYAIGAMLYRLVTGYEPIHRFEPTESRDETLQDLIRTYTPPLASRKLTEAERTEPESLATRLGIEPSKLPAWRKQLRGDLETVLSIALEKDPERRYASAQALAEDLQKVLDRVPIAGKRNLRLPMLTTMRSAKLTAVALVLLVIAMVFWPKANTSESIRPDQELVSNKLSDESSPTDKGLSADALDYLEASRLQSMFKALADHDLYALSTIELPKTATGKFLGEDDESSHAPTPSLRRLLERLTKPKPILEMRVESPINDFVLSPDNRFVVAGYEDKRARIWNLSTGKLVLTFPVQAGPVTAVLFSSDGKLLLTGDKEGYLTIWDSSRLLADDYSGQPLDIIHRGEEQQTGIESFAFSPDKKLIAVGHRYDPIIIRDLNGTEVSRIDLGEPYARNESIAFSEDGKQIICSNKSEKRLEWWDYEQQRLEKTSKFEEAEITLGSQPTEVFISDKVIYCTVNEGPEVFLVDEDTGDLFGRVVVSMRDIKSLQIVPERNLLLTAHAHGAVCLTHLLGESTGKQIDSRKSWTFPLHTYGENPSVNKLSFFGEDTLITAGNDGRICLWSMKKLLPVSQVDLQDVQDYRVTSAGKVFGIASTSEGLVLNRVNTPRASLSDSISSESSLRFKVDEEFVENLKRAFGSAIAINEAHGTVAIPGPSELNVYDLSTGETKFTIPFIGELPYQMEWSNDGSTLYGLSSAFLRAWKLSEGGTILEECIDTPVRAPLIAHKIGRLWISNKGGFVGVTYDQELSIINVATNSAVDRLTLASLDCVAISRSDDKIAVNSTAGISLYDAKLTNLNFKKNEGALAHLQFCDHDRILIGLGEGCSVRAWHIPTSTYIGEFFQDFRSGWPQVRKLTDDSVLTTALLKRGHSSGNHVYFFGYSAEAN